jgi:Kef-type K+ transport system membrane component KefB
MSADADTARFLIDVALILVLARAMGTLFARMRQPPVVGEILIGILLGPSLLGCIPGDPTSVLFGPDARAALRIVGSVALATFMFTVGWGLDVGALRRHERAAATISLASALVPFALGLALAVPLHDAHGVVGGEQVAFVPFALFIGASMAITAFPVLARILVDRDLARGPLGALVLSCAAIDDAVGWTLVVVVLGVLASAGSWEWARVVVELALFLLALRAVVHPLLTRLLASRRPALDEQWAAALLAGGALASAGVTELIGVHFVIGAFAFGLAVPRDGAAGLAGARRRIVPIAALLLPVYFVLPGLNVDVTSLTAGDTGELAVVFLAACAGKIGGAVTAARLRGVMWRDALAIGALMNTRGLIELVVLTIGYENGVLDRRLFTVMVLMAIGTTVLTGPLLSLIYRSGGQPDVPNATSARGRWRQASNATSSAMTATTLPKISNVSSSPSGVTTNPAMTAGSDSDRYATM